MDMTRRLLVVLAVLASGSAWALQPTTDSQSPVASKAFYNQELVLSSQNVPLGDLRQQMGLAKDQAWTNFFLKHGQDTQVYIDPRSGTPTKIQLHLPLIPGDGYGNRLTMQDVTNKLGLRARSVDASVVEQSLLKFINESVDVLGI